MKRAQMKQRLLALTAALAVLFGGPLPVLAAQTGGASLPPVITSFEALSEEQSTVVYENRPELSEVTSSLPASLSVFLDGAASPSSIPVAWECSGDYADVSSDSYIFIPVWDPAACTLSPELTAEQLPSVTVLVNAVRSTVYLMAPENAKKELNDLTGSKNILALVYLCDSYDIKETPGKTAKTVLSVNSGQSVRITGVAEDALRNIWYQVSLETEGAVRTGYVERGFLAYSDEDLINWEYRNISSYLFRSAGREERDVYADVNAFPSSYQAPLKLLKDAHPNWIFVKMDTELDWSDSVRQENTGQRSLISSKVNAAWKTGSYDSSWSYPTDGILSYYMDPRNFLTAETIFQFELLSYNSTYHTQAAVQGMLDTTFMSGLIPGDSRTYAEALFGIGQTNNVSPFHLAARIRVEQGVQGTSPLISGTYPGFEGLYNYFNIQASGQGTQAIVNGLTYARNQSWNTRYLSLEGGSRILSKNYINKGQDTLYLQKFNVNKWSSNGAYNHQYMQNIAAPSTEAGIIRKSYIIAGVFDKPFVFRIPVYTGMPGSACTKPAELKSVTLDKTAVTLKVTATAALTAFVDNIRAEASSVTFASSNSGVATVDGSGTVTAVSPGTADITCTQPGGTTAVCKITVEKSEPSYTLPSLDAVTYDPQATLAGIALPSGWTWDAPATVPTVDVSGYPATYTPQDTVNFHTVKKVLTLTVRKGVPSYTLPSGLTTVTGNTLASLKLPAGFSWESPATVLSEKGTVSAKASYNPDPANYNTVTGIDISITVNEKAAECTDGHTFGEWVSSSSATCTAAGSDARRCHLCGAKEERTVPALGHVYGASVTKEPTEAEAGVRTYTCARCGDTYTEAIDRLPSSHTHSYTAVVTREAACTEKGVKTFSCSCGDSYTEDISPLGHSYTAAVTKEPTEAEAGVRTYTCARCGSSYTETIAALPPSHTHNYASAITRQAACTEKGIRTFSCSCGDSYTEEIAATGHQMSGGTCTKCGYTTAPTSGSSTGNSTGGSSGSIAGSGSGTPGSGSTAGSNTTGGSSTVGSGTTASTGPNTAGGGSTAGSGSTTIGGGSTASTGPAANGGSSLNQGPQGNAFSSGSGRDRSDSVTVNMKENTVLYEETIASIRGKDVDVVLDMGHNVSWTINGGNIVYDEANGVDMGITLDSGNIPASLLEQFKQGGSMYVIELTLAHSGPLDFKPVLTINTARENAGRIATLFYYNPETETLEFVDSVTVAENGDISYPLTHASDYAVVISNEAIEDSYIINETVTAEEEITVTAEEETETPSSAADRKAFSPAIIVIIVLISLIAIAIGVTVYLMLNRRDENENMDDDRETVEPEEDLTRLSAPVKYGKEPAERYLDDDSVTPADDYHEPAVSRKTGKVISITKTAAKKADAGKREEQNTDEKKADGKKVDGKKNTDGEKADRDLYYDDDEFDGFE